MSHLLSIIGPTATGKTKFAVQVANDVAEQFIHVDLISADSRQLYKGMEIGTGVDLPAEFQLAQNQRFTYPFFASQHIRIHGLSILQPDEPWSVAQFQTFTQAIIQESWSQKSLPILVGGTGLYHQQLWQEDTKLFVMPSEEVREKAAQLTTAELQQWLKSLSPQKFASLNNSDVMNPRRLVRAIEIADAQQKQQNKQTPPPAKIASQNRDPLPEAKTLSIGLTDSIEHIAAKVAERVAERLQNGMQAETQKLIANYPAEIWQHLPAFSATGYKEVRNFLEEKITREELLILWARREVQYAKRQLTWFKKYSKDARWFMVSDDEWSRRALRQIRSWLE